MSRISSHILVNIGIFHSTLRIILRRETIMLNIFKSHGCSVQKKNPFQEFCNNPAIKFN